MTGDKTDINITISVSCLSCKVRSWKTLPGLFPTTMQLTGDLEGGPAEYKCPVCETEIKIEFMIRN